MDKVYDRMNSKMEKPLSQTEKIKRNNVTASEDPILLQLAKDVEGKVVVTTDSVLAALMCSSRSFYSWDLIITKRDGCLFLDKRPGGPLDFVTVNENASEPPLDSGEKELNINAPQSLAYEATHINRHFPEFIVKQVLFFHQRMMTLFLKTNRHSIQVNLWKRNAQKHLGIENGIWEK